MSDGEQLRLTDDLPPAHRRDDPDSSREAALEVEPRRKTQAGKILRRLRQGPASNRELAEIALKYTGRISDLRHLGCEIVVEQIDAGLTAYYLKAEPEWQERQP